MINNKGLQLRALRFTLGLSLRNVADAVGFAAASVRDFETGRTKHSPKLEAFLDSYNVPYSTLLLAAQEIAKEKNCKSIQHFFCEGHYYRISSKGPYSKSGITAPDILSGIATDTLYVFQYLRKDGKHHIFRELNGGWTRTYTDAQLVGKRIMEVNI